MLQGPPLLMLLVLRHIEGKTQHSNNNNKAIPRLLCPDLAVITLIPKQTSHLEVNTPQEAHTVTLATTCIIEVAEITETGITITAEVNMEKQMLITLRI